MIETLASQHPWALVALAAIGVLYVWIIVRELL